MDYNMRITDPQWPAVREASRRILRLQQIRIMLPHKFHSLTKKIIIQLGESQPSRTTFPILMESNKISIEMENDEDELSGTIVQVSHDEPTLETVWIRGDDELWLDVLDACTDLLSAGYPGCIGCGGPNSEKKWDEQVHRKSLQ
jgi:hypothetical protein